MNQQRGSRRSITWKTTSASAAVLMGLTLASGAPASATPSRNAGPAANPATSPAAYRVHSEDSEQKAKKHDDDWDDADDAFDADWGDDDSKESKKASKSGMWDPAMDLGSLASITAGSGAQQAWSKGVTGKGVTVAVIDTGIAPVEGLDDKGKIVNGPDLSYDSQRSGTRYVDGYGHGTHMAAVIAGRDGKVDKKLKSTDFYGIAPDAQLLNMKVASSDGGVDVSQVIAALDWVVQHRTDNGMNVRVVNLAYGTESVQAWQVDPLARAVENAWNNGLVVVTAAGNNGLDAPSLLMPAVDPHVLAVGAVDHMGTGTSADDTVAAFTSGGDADRRPDVLAPGKSVVSLRVPGSYIDREHPEGMVAGDKSDRYFRGSGTSQATAVVSGEAALLLQARPTLSPDQVKAVLRSSADPLINTSPVMGAGVVNVAKALSAPVPSTQTTSYAASSGLGTLEGSRGGEHVLDPMTGDVLSGEVDALGSPWLGQQWVSTSTAGQAWTGGTWNNSLWTGSRWMKDGWAAVEWTGSSWSGVPWADHFWSTAEWRARSWRDDGWSARSWRGDAWKARSWREEDWLARSWRDGAWRARSWRDDSWLARSWREDSWLARSWRDDSWLAGSWRSIL